ncbi:MAG: hypothetical protein ACM30I_05505 [Gemmatimonas sp.]
MPLLDRLRALVLLTAVFAAGSAATFGAWWLHGRPVDIPPAPLEGLAGGRLACVSYAPYRDGQSPLSNGFAVSPEQIEEDITVLAGHTACLRTYSTGQGLDAVVPIARKHGLKVLAGAWIGKDPDANRKEIASLIAIANRHPDTVTSVVVGNEVLLRGDLPADELARYIRDVRAAVHVPVTYADVWEFWIDAPELARAVDYVTVHLLPYWEERPMATPAALKHVAAVLRKVQATFPDKKIFVGEVGWPSLGRMREDARASPSDQARFVRGFVAVSHELGIGYNFIEAFDQKWKRAAEGTVGGHWGLYDSNRKPKVELAGAVSDDPRWPVHWWVSTALGALVLALAMVGRALPSGRPAWLASAALLAAVSGATLEAQAIYFSETVRFWYDWIASGAAFLASLVLAVTGTESLLTRAEGRAVIVRAPSKRVVGDLLGRRIQASRSFLIGLLELAILMFALAAALAIVADGRQRDFPTFVYLVPAVSFAALWVSGDRTPVAGNLPATALAAVLAVTGLATILKEHPWNTQALAWAAVALALAAPRLIAAAGLFRLSADATMRRKAKAAG